jgi:PIN domain nuclease of toxin-antitoxin system
VKSIKAGPTKKKVSSSATSVEVTKVMRKAGEEAIAGRYLDLISTHSEDLLAEVAFDVFQAMSAARKT